MSRSEKRNTHGVKRSISGISGSAAAIDGPLCVARLIPNVSRETLDRLARYAGLIRKWNAVHNLVAPSEIERIWPRHMADSAQILEFVATAPAIIDLGSGGGFPGMVLAILLQDPALRPAHTAPKLHLIEANARKSAFLRFALVELGCSAQIHETRIEKLDAGLFPRHSVICARALGPLHRLCGYAAPFSGRDGTAIFHKGRNFRREIDQAYDKWRFDLVQRASRTDPAGCLLILANIRARG